MVTLARRKNLVVDDTKANNLTKFALNKTAKTCESCANERALNLAILGVKNVLELCVGPSLSILEQAYAKFDIKCFGNDIDPRWQKYYPEGNWIIGDAMALGEAVKPFDCLVFAPPLSKGCSGRREDSLSVDEVSPKYTDFFSEYYCFKGVITLVLPARSIATSFDRQQYFRLLRRINRNYEIHHLRDNGIRKYVDIYIK